jgi:hypothetical protein
MRQSIRTYSKVVTSSAQVVNVALYDTEGNLFNPTYISVEASGPSGNFFSVMYSPDSFYGATQSALGNRDADAIGLTGNSADGSAILGGFASLDGGIVEISLKSSEDPTALLIRKPDTTQATFFITYGSTKEINTLADNKLGSGV